MELPSVAFHDDGRPDDHEVDLEPLDDRVELGGRKAVVGEELRHRRFKHLSAGLSPSGQASTALRSTAMPVRPWRAWRSTSARSPVGSTSPAITTCSTAAGIPRGSTAADRTTSATGWSRRSHRGSRARGRPDRSGGGPRPRRAPGRVGCGRARDRPDRGRGARRPRGTPPTDARRPRHGRWTARLPRSAADVYGVSPTVGRRPVAPSRAAPTRGRGTTPLTTRPPRSPRRG